jgi:hypothetical protein
VSLLTSYAIFAVKGFSKVEFTTGIAVYRGVVVLVGSGTSNGVIRLCQFLLKNVPLNDDNVRVL